MELSLPSAVTPGVVVLTVTSAPLPVRPLVRVIIATSSLATFDPENVTVAVPIPAVIDATATTVPPDPSEAKPLRAVWMLLMSVELVELHEIGPVEALLNFRTNVPPEIEPAKVSVCTSLVPALGAVAVLYTLPCGG